MLYKYYKHLFLMMLKNNQEALCLTPSVEQNYYDVHNLVITKKQWTLKSFTIRERRVNYISNYI